MTFASSPVEVADRRVSKSAHSYERALSGGAAVAVHEIDPLADARWDQLVVLHPNASIFHTRAWLEALQRTYGYWPVVYATTRGTQLEEAGVFGGVESGLAGRRLVSLPFSDHCQPLASGAALDAILAHVREQQQRAGLRYLELRPLTRDAQGPDYAGFAVSERVSFQTIDLRPDLPIL